MGKEVTPSAPNVSDNDKYAILGNGYHQHFNSSLSPALCAGERREQKRYVESLLTPVSVFSSACLYTKKLKVGSRISIASEGLMFSAPYRGAIPETTP